jgi:hypothetical protein
LATALLRADGATTGVDHGVRGWRFWVDFQEDGLGSLEVSLPPTPFYILLRVCCHHMQHSFLVIVYVNK